MAFGSLSWALAAICLEPWLLAAEYPWHWEVAGRKLWRLHQNGTFRIPASVDRVVLDVGAHNDTDWTDLVLDHTDLFVIAFEPRWWFNPPDLRRLKHPRIMLVPALVGSRGGFVEMYELPDEPEIASTLPLTSRGSDTFLPGKKKALKDVAMRTELVPMVSLFEVLTRLPPRLEITFIKIDAQGADMDVVKSAGQTLLRALRVQVEVQDLKPGHRDIVYAGQAVKADFVEKMPQWGFHLERCWDNTPGVREENCVFARYDVRKATRGDCFKRREYRHPVRHVTPTLANWAPDALLGPAWIVFENLAKIAEYLHCLVLSFL